jgi:diguanylate cyclase (GGDEF)-like protein
MHDSPSILVVEDEAVIAIDLRDTLASVGYQQVALVMSSDDVFSQVAARRPDLVLMDIQIKGALDGIEIAGLLRARHHVPVVYLTAHSDDATVDRAKHSGAYGFLLKPTSAAALRSAIEVALYNHAIETQSQERAEREALTDPLTGLWNRRAWERILSAEESRLQRHGHPACIVSIDLDELKKTNDSLGHAAGDALIQRAANALRAALRGHDAVARLGGDEFGVLLDGRGLRAAERVLARVRASLAREGVRASVGAAESEPPNSLADAWSRADQEMYLEKREHKKAHPG